MSDQTSSNENIIEFLRTRRSVVAANLSDPGPTDDELNTIIDIGLRVPDHGRCGPWRIQIIKKEGQSRLGELYKKLFAEEDENPTAERIDYWRLRPQSAPILLAITCYPNEEKLAKIPLWEQTLSGATPSRYRCSCRTSASRRSSRTPTASRRSWRCSRATSSACRWRSCSCSTAERLWPTGSSPCRTAIWRSCVRR